jgi:DNA-binding MarR family transcriptional regulator
MARSRSPRTASAPSPVAGPEHTADEVLQVVPAVMDALRNAMRHHVGEQLSVPQFRCLNFIAHHPGASVSAVAAFLGVALPTASTMVDRLVRAGAVEPRTAADDRRRSQLHLTAAGSAQLAEIRLGARSELAQVLASRSAEELDSLHAGLAVLRRVFVAPESP